MGKNTMLKLLKEIKKLDEHNRQDVILTSKKINDARRKTLEPIYTNVSYDKIDGSGERERITNEFQYKVEIPKHTKNGRVSESA